MAISKLTSPQAVATGVGDWQAAVNLIEKAFLNYENGIRIDYDNDLVLSGSIFQVGGSVYIATSDTAITGTPSDYVKLTISGSTLVPSYVANLTGVTWNATYKGYYDVSGYLYVFDEMKVESLGPNIITNELLINNVLKGFIGVQLTEWSTTTQPQIEAGGSCEINGKLYINESAITISGSVSNSTWYAILLTPSGRTYTASFVLESTTSWDNEKQGVYSANNRVVGYVYVDASGNFINKNLLVSGRLQKRTLRIGSWNMDSTGSVVVIVSTGATFFNNYIISRSYATIIPDLLNVSNNIETTSSGSFSAGSVAVYVNAGNTSAVVYRYGGGGYDSASFDDSSINRGFITVDYYMV